MKHAKKLVSLLLALVMILSMSVTAFAAGETGTITVENPVTDASYTAYKIFDVIYDEAKTAYSYTISGTSEWFDVVATKDANTGDVTSKVTGLKFEKAYSEDTYVVIKGDGFSAADFAKTLKANISGKTGNTLTISNGKATATGLPLGYYLVVGTKGAETEALANLTTTNHTVTIHDKNDNPFDKADDKASVEIGEVVNYVITGKVPDTTGFETYKYQITDKMSTGLTFNNDVKVYINETEITENYTIKTGTNAGENDFILDIEVMNLTVGAKIEVKYSATVNENAVATIEKNHATLVYSNDPTDSKATTTREDEEDVYSAKIVIDKYVKDDNTKKLANAEFVLYKEVTAEGATEVTKLYYKYTAATQIEKAKVEWVNDIKDATHVVTDNGGVANFNGLKDGTYYLEETKAPAGYNLLKAPVEVIINGANATAADTSSLTVTKGVENNTGSLLPSTGGMGTTIFYVIGSILLIGAAVLLITKRRMNAEK